MKNPYTLMFGREPLQTISRQTQINEVVTSLTAEPFTPNLFMISGLRGSGKTVFMTEIGKEIMNASEWIVIELNSSGNLLNDLAAAMASENNLAQMFKSAKINLSLFGIGLEVEGSVAISNIQTALTKMLKTLKKHNKRVLVCIDEVTATEEMKLFAGAFQIFIRQDLPISLIMTGLHKNIDSLKNTDNLTFLYRAPRIELLPLNLSSIAANYRSVLGVSHDVSLSMAKITRGYSFAFQVLGYYTWEDSKRDFTEVLPMVRTYLEDSVYVKLWSELSSGDKRLLKSIVDSENGRAKDIKAIMRIDNAKYSVYRSRLIKNGIIVGDIHGYVRITLPMFEEFVKDNSFFEE